MIENMTRKFGNVTVGIHGQELPKFAGEGETKEFWKFAETYGGDMQSKSALEMKENNKWWAKNDDMKLADVKEEQAPQDAFKSVYVEKRRNDQVHDKVQTMNHWRSGDGEAKEVEFQRGFNKVTKWSEQEKFQRCSGDERLFDKLVRQAKAYETGIEQVEKERAVAKEAYLSKMSPLKKEALDSSRVN
mmetsp:Transcript_35808/g.26598  ORF Transcript_35808/g.26598 Transcript_35808/m.26598 type:complete len:188 (+) Transcript_35808:1074-1637(+)